jgi:hypothetical protein
LEARLGCAEASETAREAWLNTFVSRCVLDFGISRSWPFGQPALSPRRPPEFITRAAALGKVRHVRRAVLCWLPEFGCWCNNLY